ncbi:MAG: hypothetical protein ACTHU0_21660 [Kofleriaceae bacterium]
MYRDLLRGAKRGIPRAVRFIFLELCHEAADGGGVLSLPVGMSDVDALHDLLGGDRGEIQQALRILFIALPGDDDGLPMARLLGEEGGRRVEIVQWRRWALLDDAAGDNTSARPAPDARPCASCAKRRARDGRTTCGRCSTARRGPDATSAPNGGHDTGPEADTPAATGAASRPIGTGHGPATGADTDRLQTGHGTGLEAGHDRPQHRTRTGHGPDTVPASRPVTTGHGLRTVTPRNDPRSLSEISWPEETAGAPDAVSAADILGWLSAQPALRLLVADATEADALAENWAAAAVTAGARRSDVRDAITSFVAKEGHSARTMSREQLVRRLGGFLVRGKAIGERSRAEEAARSGTGRQAPPPPAHRWEMAPSIGDVVSPEECAEAERQLVELEAARGRVA